VLIFESITKVICFCCCVFQKAQGKPLRWVTKAEALQYLTEEMTDMETFKRDILNPIMVERISGTPEIAKVREVSGMLETLLL
jgi:hypothetical protein